MLLLRNMGWNDTVRLIACRAEPSQTAELSRVTAAEIFVAGSALLMLITAQWILSSTITGTNYLGLDGKGVQSVVLAAFKFAGYFDVTNLHPIQGVGSQLLPKNVWANPSLWPFALFAKETATDVSALVALACFVGAVYVMMRCFDIAVLPSVLTAQSCIALFAPALLIAYAPTNFCLTPGDAVVYAPYMIALGILGRLPPDFRRSFVLMTAAIILLVLYSIYCDPLWTVIAAVSWAVPFAVVSLSPLQPRAVMLRTAALGTCVAVLLLSGAASYLFTLSQYTARVQFAQTLDRVRQPVYVSAMTYSPNMRYFYFACIVGWVLGIATLSGRARVLVMAATTACAAWAGYSIVYLLLLNVAWMPPIPIYVEQCLFPLYLAAAAAGYWGMVSLMASLLVRGVAPLARGIGEAWRQPVPMPPPSAQPAEVEIAPRSSRLMGATVVVTFLAATIVPAKVVKYALSDGRADAKTFYQPWTNEPELIGFLDENIGLANGLPFRGRINFFTPSGFTMATLWSHAIPTLNEINHLVTPEALYFIHAALEIDVRGYLNHFQVHWSNSPLNWKVLQLFGTRYVAATAELADESNPALPPVTKPHRPENEEDPKPGTWYIYELPHPNVGDYSPTVVMTARSGSDVIAAIGKPDFDFARQAVLSAPVPEKLVPAHDMRLSIIRGGLHVSAKSAGTSLVILPKQFSHCLRARESRVRFVRANLMMAGMVFSGDVDTDIVFDYGLFSPGCRRKDLADLKQLDLKIDLPMPHLTGDRLLPDWDGAVERLRGALAAIQ